MNIYDIFEIFQENKLEKHKITVWKDWIIAPDQIWIRVISHMENWQESSWTRNLVHGQRVNLFLSESSAWENLSTHCLDGHIETTWAKEFSLWGQLQQ